MNLSEFEFLFAVSLKIESIKIKCRYMLSSNFTLVIFIYR